ncbi:MAG: FCD domain-containing protein [Chloroflexi bacterium]|nr:FCD domain-containing protein [Chloroflexota bacterium]
MEHLNQNIYKLSELLTYLASVPESAGQRIPPLSELSHKLGISVASLREQLEVARLLGIVEIRPKSGIKKIQYSLKPAILASLTYGIECNSQIFAQVSDIRKHLESAYFIEAAQMLSTSDKEELASLVKMAQQKLRSIPSQLPNIEHKEFHLIIYRRLNNYLVVGILETYWDLYKRTGLDVYTDINYVDRVWQYHARIVEHIKQGNFNQGLAILLEHMDLISQRERQAPRLSFE